MSAVDFVLYCAGLGLLLLSGAGAVRLTRRERRPELPPAPPKKQPEPEVPGGDLVDRLQQFQQQRFASPIIRRQLDREGYAPTPGEPGGRRVVPGQLRQLPKVPPRQPRKGPPPLPKQDTSNVIPLPLKPGDPNKKD